MWLPLQLATADDKLEQFSIQTSLCGVIQVIVNRLEAGVEPFADQIMTVLHRVRAPASRERGVVPWGLFAGVQPGGIHRHRRRSDGRQCPGES